jgi:hypothetical protein
MRVRAHLVGHAVQVQLVQQVLDARLRVLGRQPAQARVQRQVLAARQHPCRRTVSAYPLHRWPQ